MRIKKTLFSTEVEFTPNEFREIQEYPWPELRFAINEWLKNMIGTEITRSIIEWNKK